MRLEEWLIETGTTQGKLARELEITQTAISRYVSGARMPRAEHMVEIYRITEGDVTPNDFVLAGINGEA